MPNINSVHTHIHILNLSHVSWLTDAWLQELQFPGKGKIIYWFWVESILSETFLTTHILQYVFAVKYSFLFGVNKLYSD